MVRRWSRSHEYSARFEQLHRRLKQFILKTNRSGQDHIEYPTHPRCILGELFDATVLDINIRQAEFSCQRTKERDWLSSRVDHREPDSRIDDTERYAWNAGASADVGNASRTRRQERPEQERIEE